MTSGQLTAAEPHSKGSSPVVPRTPSRSLVAGTSLQCSDGLELVEAKTPPNLNIP